MRECLSIIKWWHWTWPLNSLMNGAATITCGSCSLKDIDKYIEEMLLGSTWENILCIPLNIMTKFVEKLVGG